MVESGNPDGPSTEGLEYLNQLLNQVKGRRREALGGAAADLEAAVRDWSAARRELSALMPNARSLLDQARNSAHPRAGSLESLVTQSGTAQSPQRGSPLRGGALDELRRRNGVVDRALSWGRPKETVDAMTEALRADTRRITQQTEGMRADIRTIWDVQAEFDGRGKAEEPPAEQSPLASRIADEVRGRFRRASADGGEARPGRTQPSRAPVPQAREGQGQSAKA
ncbi:hypothetical protein LG943_24745 [Streptomonospora sp. S1-112]|uniref:Uncharacterized protein n=1 Tax=Streptomonospora mangrovi TaxID=2883123 RepID=A0A9X3NQV8_9ACTN|nr:hypothetical protein [Streptomonospora mangrovi]MDA0567505.1 hypothetical protein [Streptomonospora mangrovi]